MERESHRIVIFTNLLHSMRNMLEAMEKFKITFENPELAKYLPLFSNIPVVKRGDPYPEEYMDALRALWSDAGVKTSMAQANECAINDAAE